MLQFRFFFFTSVLVVSLALVSKFWVGRVFLAGFLVWAWFGDEACVEGIDLAGFILISGSTSTDGAIGRM